MHLRLSDDKIHYVIHRIHPPLFRGISRQEIFLLEKLKFSLYFLSVLKSISCDCLIKNEASLMKEKEVPQYFFVSSIYPQSYPQGA